MCGSSLGSYNNRTASPPFMATERIHEPGTQNEVAKALRGRKKEGLVTIPEEFSFCFTYTGEIRLTEEQLTHN